jgi:DNA repair protein RecO
MAAEKTRAFVLKSSPYRESSSLIYLFSERHGLVHGVAKGVRRNRSGLPCLERGFLVELLVYARPHRDLHTLADISVHDFFPDVRTDLCKGAVRDMAFEVILSTMSTDAPHPEVFDYLSEFLFRLESNPPHRCFPVMAWRFFHDFSSLMGFGLNVDACGTCGRPFSGMSGGHLLVESGMLACDACARRPNGGASFVPAAVLSSLSEQFGGGSVPEGRRISAADAARIIRLFARFCQYHFQTSSGFKSVDFIDSLLASPAVRVPGGRP